MKPNIIIVMTDQQRADLRKSCGCSLDTMPFLDEWAKGGVDFSRAYTPNPICLAARASMFTGRYSHSHQVRSNQNVEDILYTKDLLDVMKENGYITALCGKNHTYHKESEFDFCAGTGHLSNKITEDTSEEYKEFGKFLSDTDFVAGDEPAPNGVEVQHPYQNVSSALEFIDSVPENTPFFTWVSFAEPHNPYQVPYPYYNMFQVDELPKCVTAEEAKEANKGSRFERMRDIWEHVYGPDVEARILRSRSNYFGMLRLIDDQFKRLIEGLQERNIEDDTIVIYLSDHGDFVGEYGLMRKGGDLSELLTHIPMVWKGPGITPRGRDEENFVSLIDILPTFCAILEIERPYGVQGKSICPLLENKKGFEKEFQWAFVESGFSGLYWNDEDELRYVEEGAARNQEITAFDCLNSWTQSGQVRALRKGNYKIQMDMMGTGFLYELSSDPMELHNLWDSEKHQSMKMEMIQSLMTATLQACDILPLPHNRYRTKLHPKGYWYDESYHSKDMGVVELGPLGDIFTNRKKYYDVTKEGPVVSTPKKII